MASSTSPSIKTDSFQAFLAKTTPEEVRIHYQIADPPSQKKGTILLIHGYPESSYQFRHVIPLLARAGYKVIAPDYRGHGHSNPPTNSTVDMYTKRQLATDLHDLVTKHLNIKEKIHVIGHDIGGMIAHAYVAQFPSDVEILIWGECPLPGSTVYEKTKHDPDLWHFDFQSHHPDLAVSLVSGKEELYLTHFYDRLAQKPNSFTNEVVQTYVRQYSRSGALRAGFLSYKAFETDGEDNKRWREKDGKVKVRNMVLSGEGSFLKGGAESIAREFYENPVVGLVEGSGHWLAEENPEGFAEEVLRFVEGG